MGLAIAVVEEVQRESLLRNEIVCEEPLAVGKGDDGLAPVGVRHGRRPPEVLVDANVDDAELKGRQPGEVGGEGKGLVAGPEFRRPREEPAVGGVDRKDQA